MSAAIDTAYADLATACEALATAIGDLKKEHPQLKALLSTLQTACGQTTDDRSAIEWDGLDCTEIEKKLVYWNTEFAAVKSKTDAIEANIVTLTALLAQHGE